MRVGAAKKEAGRVFGFVKIQLPEKEEPNFIDHFCRLSIHHHIDR